MKVKQDKNFRICLIYTPVCGTLCTFFVTLTNSKRGELSFLKVLSYGGWGVAGEGGVCGVQNA